MKKCSLTNQFDISSPFFLFFLSFSRFKKTRVGREMRNLSPFEAVGFQIPPKLEISATGHLADHVKTSAATTHIGPIYETNPHFRGLAKHSAKDVYLRVFLKPHRQTKGSFGIHGLVFGAPFVQKFSPARAQTCVQWAYKTVAK